MSVTDARSAAAGDDTIDVPADDPVRAFADALEPHVRAVLPLDHHTIAAVRALVDRGRDLTDVARICGHGTAGRSEGDRRALARFRLAREAGLLDDLLVDR